VRAYDRQIDFEKEHVDSLKWERKKSEKLYWVRGTDHLGFLGRFMQALRLTQLTRTIR
jgi:nicotinic acid mononucleotide adenylyltransferase